MQALNANCCHWTNNFLCRARKESVGTVDAADETKSGNPHGSFQPQTNHWSSISIAIGQVKDEDFVLAKSSWRKRSIKTISSSFPQGNADSFRHLWISKWIFHLHRIVVRIANEPSVCCDRWQWQIVDQIRSFLSSGLRSVSVASVGIFDLFPYFMARVWLSFVRTTVDHSR